MNAPLKSILEFKNVTMSFGGLKAVSDLSFAVGEKELVALIGPNGAGKTTVFNVMTGIYRPQSGNINFRNKSVLGLKAHQISGLGLGRTFQNIRLFKNLTVMQNVLIGAQPHFKYGFWEPLVLSSRFLETEANAKKYALELLGHFDLKQKQDELASSLPYGEQRKLEMVRSLIGMPRLICLDEPAAGMNHKETEDLMNLILKIKKDFDQAVFLIEHDMKLVMGISERIVVLDHGCCIEEGSPEKVRGSKAVIEAYLGADGGSL